MSNMQYLREGDRVEKVGKFVCCVCDFLAKHIIALVFFAIIVILAYLMYSMQSNMQSLNETSNALEATIKKSGTFLNSNETVLEIEHLKERIETIIDFQSNMLTLIGIIAALVTVVVAACGIVAPVIINKKYEKRLSEEIILLKTRFNEQEQKVEEAARNAKASELKADLSKQFGDALNEVDLQKRIALYEALIDNQKDAQDEFSIFTDADYNYEIAGIKNNIAATKAKLKDYEGAIEDYNIAIKLDSTSATYFYNRGNAKSKLGNYEGGIQDYNHAIELDDQNAQYFNNRGYIKLKINDLAGGLFDVNKAIELDDSKALYFCSRGEIHREMKMYNESLNDYNKAIKLDINFIDIYKERALLYRAMADNEQSAQERERYLQLADKDDYKAKILGAMS